MSKLRKEIEEVTIDLYLSLLSVLPDCSHVLKTCKTSFSNWYLELKNERVLYTPQNKVEPKVHKTIKKLLKSNDYA